jgi:hypothetical protein
MGTLAIKGFVSGKSFGIDPVFCVDAKPVPPAPGPFKLRLLDAQGKERASYPFDIVSKSGAAESATVLPQGTFQLLVPATAFDELVIETEGAPPLRKRASPNAPEIALEPITAASFLPNRKIHFAWTRRDADPGRLFIKLETSGDDGKTWRDVPGTFAEQGMLDLDLRWLKPSDTTRLRATVSDGLRCGRDEIGPFVVPKRPPMVRIRQTYKPQIAKADTLNMLVDVGSENGAVDDKAIVWSSSLDGELGRGRTIAFVGKDRTTGKHTITASFTDSAGLTATHQLDVEIVK